MLRVLLASPDPNDSQAWWRVVYPLLVADEILLSMPSVIGWMEVAAARVLLLQRPFLPDHIRLIRLARELKVPVVLDYDDLLWELPPGHPAQLVYGRSEIAAATECVRRADAVMASTEELAAYLRSLGGKNVFVIPNALPAYVTWASPRSESLIWWRGGITHNSDLALVEDDLVAALRARPDWRLQCCGMDRPRIRTACPSQYAFLPPLPIRDYHQSMIDMSPSIMIGPLEDSPFNRCKSEIGWLEASMAGAIYVAPKFPVYDLPGCSTYRAGDFLETLLHYIDMSSAERLARLAAARAAIDQRYRLTGVNPKRIRLLKEIADV